MDCYARLGRGRFECRRKGRKDPDHSVEDIEQKVAFRVV